MKNLKVKSILFSLLAMMAVAVFLTSCEHNIIVNETENISTDSNSFLNQSSSNHLLLTELLQDDNFQSIADSKYIRRNAISTFFVNNLTSIRSNKGALMDFIKDYDLKHQSKINSLFKDLINEFPEFRTMPVEEFSNLFAAAQANYIYTNIQLSSRSCWDDCHTIYLDNMDRLYDVYLYRLNNECPSFVSNTYDECNEEYYNYFLSMNALNVENFYDCLDSNC